MAMHNMHDVILAQENLLLDVENIDSYARLVKRL